MSGTDSDSGLLDGPSIWWHWHILGVQITDNQETLVFINVHLPFQCEDNYANCC